MSLSQPGIACVHKDRRDGEVHGHVRIVLPNQEAGETKRRSSGPCQDPLKAGRP